MNERLKNIRKKLSLSQASFGKRIGVTGAGISKIESGDRGVTEQMVLAICREFNINEEWLRYGKGEMFLDFTEDEFARAASSLSSDVFVRSLIVEYWKLDDDSRALFRDFIHRLSENMKGHPVAEPAADLSELSIDQKVELYRQELEREEKAGGRSEAS